MNDAPGLRAKLIRGRNRECLLSISLTYLTFQHTFLSGRHRLQSKLRRFRNLISGDSPARNSVIRSHKSVEKEKAKV